MIFKKSVAAYTAAKGYENWLGVTEVLEPMPDKEWKTERPNTSQQYAKNPTTMVSCEGEPDILKQEWIVVDCESKKNWKATTTISNGRSWLNTHCIGRMVRCVYRIMYYYNMANSTVIL